MTKSRGHWHLKVFDLKKEKKKNGNLCFVFCPKNNCKEYLKNVKYTFYYNFIKNNCVLVMIISYMILIIINTILTS